MKPETVSIGSFDAGKQSLREALSRTKWMSELEKNLEKRQAISVIDAREHELPPYLTDRLTISHIENAQRHFDTLFGPDWKDGMKGKTFVVAYTKFGHGHKHQAYDLSLLLAHMTRSRVVCFDPMDALPDRERNSIKEAKALHKAMQDRDMQYVKKLADMAKHPPTSHPALETMDKITNSIGLVLADLAFRNLPASQETGNDAYVDAPKNFLERFIQKYPEKLVRPIVQTQSELTERSVSAATTAIAASYGADAILTTHPNTIRAMTPDVITWIPRTLHKAARHALTTIITVTPDNGYVVRKPDGSEGKGLSHKDKLDDVIVTSQFTFVFNNAASWLKRGLHVVADDYVARKMHEYWKIPESQYFPYGTMADTITKEHFESKWNRNERRILIASNGNGSNIPDASRAIDEIAAVSPAYLSENNMHLDIFLADLPDRKDEIMQSLKKHGMTDQAEIIDYTKEFYVPGKRFTYSTDPAKRIHIAFGTGDAAGSELKQLMQREAHYEIRSPGENALTGAKVGALELCTPPGGPNEIYNMIWAGKAGIAYAINWTSDPKAKSWQSTGLTEVHGLISDTDAATIPSLIAVLRKNGRDTRDARRAFEGSNMHTGYAIVGLLVGEILRRNRTDAPSRADTARGMRQLAAHPNPGSTP